MKMHIHIHVHQESNELKEVLSTVNKIHKNQITIMTKLEELQKQFDDQTAKIEKLQNSLDSEQDQIKAAIEGLKAVKADLEAQIQILKDQIANGATPEQLQGFIDTATASNTRLDEITTDLEGTIVPEPPPTA